MRSQALWQKGDNVCTKIAKENLPALFHRIAAKNELYLPVRQNGQVNYAAWSEDAVPELDTFKDSKITEGRFLSAE